MFIRTFTLVQLVNQAHGIGISANNIDCHASDLTTLCRLSGKMHLGLLIVYLCWLRKIASLYCLESIIAVFISRKLEFICEITSSQLLHCAYGLADFSRWLIAKCIYAYKSWTMSLRYLSIDIHFEGRWQWASTWLTAEDLLCLTAF